MRSGLYVNFGVNRNAPRITGVWNITFQNALQSTSRIRFRHQSGPPPCSAPKTSVPAEARSGPLALAEPFAASASAASATPAKSQSFRRCIYPSLSGLDLRAGTPKRRADRRDRSEAHYANGDSRSRGGLARITRTNREIRERVAETPKAHGSCAFGTDVSRSVDVRSRRKRTSSNIVEPDAIA